MNPRSKLPRYLIASLLATLVSACVFVIDSDGAHWHDGRYHSNALKGSGVSMTEPRNVPEFHRIEINGGCDVALTVGTSSGGATGGATLTATADDNFLPLLVTEVRDGALVIEMKPGSYSPRVTMKIVGTVPALDAVIIRGSSDVDLSGVEGPKFSAEISGSGNVRVRGKVGSLSARISGSGDMHLYDLEAREGTVELSGSGDIEVWTTEVLTASIAGSGDVRYKGDPPRFSKSVAGSGSVKKR